MAAIAPTSPALATAIQVKAPKFCVVLPCYNEETCVAQHIRAIDAVLKKIDASTAIIAVNDGSTDNTQLVLERLAKTMPSLIVENRTKNGGYGGANRSGFAAAIREGFDYALVMDADGTQDPEFILSFCPLMMRGVDFIKATRYVKGSSVLGVDFRRRLISQAGNMLAKLALRTPLTDYTNGFRAIKVDLLSRISTTERGFAMLIEEVVAARKLGATYAEVPYQLTVRPDEGSKSKFTYSWKVYCSYLKYLFTK